MEPDKRALVWINTEEEEHVFSFEDIRRESNKAANALINSGIKKGDRVIMSLLKLGKNPEGMTVSELARSCIEDKAAISRMLEELAELGYVSLTSSGRNQKRHSKIKLTKAGMDIVKDMNDYIYKLADMIRKDISKEDEKVFYRVFEQINKNLADYTEMLPARNKTAKKKSSTGRSAGE